MVVAQAAFPHQRVRHGHFERFGEGREFPGRPRRVDAAAHIQDRPLCHRERLDDVGGD